MIKGAIGTELAVKSCNVTQKIGADILIYTISLQPDLRHSTLRTSTYLHSCMNESANTVTRQNTRNGNYSNTDHDLYKGSANTMIST